MSYKSITYKGWHDSFTYIYVDYAKKQVYIQSTVFQGIIMKTAKREQWLSNATDSALLILIFVKVVFIVSLTYQYF